MLKSEKGKNKPVESNQLAYELNLKELLRQLIVVINK